MRLAIVGSQLLKNEGALQIIRELFELYKPTVLVSGGAEGIDSMAEAYAKEVGVATDIYRPEVFQWEDRGHRKGFRSRNIQIADNCDVLIRIANKAGKTYGSGWTRDRARSLGKFTEEYVL